MAEPVIRRNFLMHNRDSKQIVDGVQQQKCQ